MLNTIIGDIPPFQCFVRREFLRDHEDGHGEMEEAVAIGAVVRKDMALCFTVLLKSGALWYELPIHALAGRAGAPPMALTCCQMWDCLSSEWVAHRYDHLRHLTVFVKLAGDVGAASALGEYLFTIDMAGSFYADHPAEHKTLNVIQLESGQIVAYPNNRCLWEDVTFTDHNLPRKYKRTSQHYFCETGSEILPMPLPPGGIYKQEFDQTCPRCGEWVENKPAFLHMCTRKPKPKVDEAPV